MTVTVTPINVGTAPNDGSGDPIRTAFQITNSNFSNIALNIGGNVTGIANGTSNIQINSSNGNPTVSVAGVANVAVFRTSGISLLGNVTAGGSINAVSITTGSFYSPGNISAGNIFSPGTISGNLINSAGNLSAGNIYSPGNLNAGNIYSPGNISSNTNVLTRNLYTLPGGTFFAGVATATSVPIKFDNSANGVVTPSPGSMEFVNDKLLFSPYGNFVGLINSVFSYNLGVPITLASSATPQAWLDKGVGLDSNVMYQFTAQFYVTTTGTVPHVEQIGFGGNAVLGNIWYSVSRENATVASTDTANLLTTQYLSTNATSNMSGALNTAQSAVYKMSGMIVVVTAGNVVPQWSTNTAIGGTSTISPGAYFNIWPLRTGNVGNVAIGNWT